MREILVASFLLLGVFFMVAGSIGIVRFPDVLCRGHALAKAMTLGIILMLLGAWLHLKTEEAGLKVLLAIAFQVVTLPVASHLIGLVALHQKLPRWRERPISELKKNRAVEPPE